MDNTVNASTIVMGSECYACLSDGVPRLTAKKIEMKLLYLQIHRLLD